MHDPTSDMTFRPQAGSRPRRDDEAWEAVVREELLKLRRRTPPGRRVVPVSRDRPAGAAEDPGTDAA